MLKRILLYAAYIAIIIVLIGAIIAAFHSSKTAPKKIANTGATQVQQATGKTGGALGANKPPSQPKPQAVTTTTPPPPANSGAAATHTAAPGQLNNTGPGDMVALFIGSVLAGSFGFTVYQRRKLA